MRTETSALTRSIPRALRGYVHSIVDYDLVLPSPGRHLATPGAHHTLVIPLHDSIEVAWLTRPQTRRTVRSSVTGLHSSAAVIHHPARQRGIQVGLTVSGLRALRARPNADLAHEFAELDDAWPALADLPERLHEIPTSAGRLDLVTQRLLQISRDTRPLPAPVDEALSVLAWGWPVSRVASHVGYSRRRLSTLVRSECGVGPKEFGRIARFHRARADAAAAARRGPVLWARVAAQHGFTDQSHLTREWSAMTGLSPAAWVWHEFPYLQYDPTGERAV